MADPRMQNEVEQWRTPPYRQQIVQKLEDAMRNSQTPMPKSSVEMEEYVFRKARSGDEYLDFVARVLLSVQDHKNKKAVPGMGPGGGSMGGGPPVMVGGPSGMEGPNTSMEGSGGAMGGPGAGMVGGGMGGPGGGMVGPPGGGMMGPGGGMPGPPGSMAGPPPPQGGQDPINALTNLAGQGAPGMGRQQPGMMQGMHVMGGGGPPMVDQSHMMRAPTRMRAQIPQKPTQLTTMPGVQGQALPASSASMVYQGPGGPIRSMNPMGMPQGYMPGRDVGMGAMPVQSPAQGSPVTMMPSPHQQGMMASPMMRPPMGAGAPSPSTMLHTPGNAYTDPSPGPPSQSQEEMEYVKKLEKLSKYIEPLRKSLLESEKKTDEESKRKNQKIQSLLDILSNPKKRRIPIDVLEKCEQVLLKLTSSGGSSSSNGHMCQPLLDAVAHFSSASSLNHSLYRTFGPALEAYMGPPIKAPSPPPSRKRKLEKEPTEELPDVLQGEIARLGSRFIVSVDPRRHAGSETHHLVCKLEDPRLPSVPPLLVTIPKTYPRFSPQCEPGDCPGYDATEFFQNVEKNLTVHLSNMPNRFCLTQLLTSWEMSVRKACDPKSPLITHPSSIFV